jgi:hypothetical protein
MLDFREDELCWEFHEKVAFTISTNTGDAEVPTSLDEVVGIVPLFDMDTFASGDSITAFGTDGVITSSAVTVRIVTVLIDNGAFSSSLFVVGRKKRVDV